MHPWQFKSHRNTIPDKLFNALSPYSFIVCFILLWRRLGNHTWSGISDRWSYCLLNIPKISASHDFNKLCYKTFIKNKIITNIDALNINTS